ncbi:Cj0814 family flagellar-dependent secreted protein [Campylobacter troglodytis]|uniref:Cj0814 family flagellar-dependent secreted protein n=1 Tax=Campylobacter troglodytis TaxID=654363 RepID=UPI003D05EC1B
MGIPSDYKIHSSTMQSLVNANTSGFTRTFNSVDIAKSVGNAYKIPSQVVGYNVLNSNYSFTKDEISQFSQGYEFNYQSLKVNKIYNTKSKLITAIEGFDYESAFKNRQGISTVFQSNTNIFNNLTGGEESGVH